MQDNLNEKTMKRRDILRMGAGASLTGGLAMSQLACSQQAGGLVLTTTVGDRRPVDAAKPIRTGYIGVGGRGNYVLERVMKLKHVHMVAIADIDPANIDKAVKKVTKAGQPEPDTNFEGEYGYRKLLARDDIDAVMIATPCDLHAPMLLDAIAAGKHVYCEKPMAITLDSANAVHAAGMKNQNTCFIGFQRRGSKRYEEGVKLIQSGEIGEPLDARGAWDNVWGPIGRPDEGARIWLGRREHSGDWMLEQACHTWDVFNWALGKLPIKAYGTGTKEIYRDMDPDRDVTDFYTATVIYDGDLQMAYHHSWFCPPENNFEGVYERIAGKKGGIDMETGKVTYREKGKSPIVLQKDEGDHTELAVAHFFDCVHNGTKSKCNVTEGRDATLFGLLVRAAVDKKGEVTMKDVIAGRA
jgi:predicted dehydrogenase